MGKKYDFDYIIIGGGPAGIAVASNLAKKTKKRIALVENRATLGGSSLSRNIPYAFNLDFAHDLFKLKNRPEFNSQTLHYNLPTLITHQATIADRLRAEYLALLESTNITLLDGHAYFIDSHTITVGETQHTAGTFIIATGSKLQTSHVFGLDTTDHLTPESVVKLRRLPKYAVVIGGGPTGCEIATYLAELGTKVILMEREAHLLPKEDAEIGTALAEHFAKKLGITVATNAEAIALEQHGPEKHIVFSLGGQEKTAHIESVILATGSVPNLDFGLENAEVKFKDSGITVNRLFQTSAKNIYAIGDCLGDEVSSTERVEYQASILVTNLINKSKNYAKYSGFIRTVNTSPQIAMVGKTEAKLKQNKRKYSTAIVHLRDLPAGKISEEDCGFIKIIADHTGRVIGGAVFAPHASLIAEELVLAVRGHLNILDLASAPHPNDDFNLAVKLAAKSLIKQ